MKKQIAIIGAGISGLRLALELSPVADIRIFEKSRGYGGRMATRRADPYAFDHGAQYFTARSPEFQLFLEQFLAAGIVQPWDATLVSIEAGTLKERQRSEPIYVASPGMSALGRAVGEALHVSLGAEIASVDGNPGEWFLATTTENKFGPFDWVISSAPAPQAANHLPDKFSEHEALARTEFLPGFALMAGFDNTFDIGFDGAFVEGSPIGFFAVNSNKPGRGPATSVVIQSNNIWAAEHVEDDRDSVADTLWSNFTELVPGLNSEPQHRVIHRWLYANVKKSAGSRFLIDKDNQLGACGDWCINGRVEAAFESGRELGVEIRNHL